MLGQARYNKYSLDCGTDLAELDCITTSLLSPTRLTLMVMSCVLLTLVDLVACLHYWGVTIGSPLPSSLLPPLRRRDVLY